jgi:hypothetical protein
VKENEKNREARRKARSNPTSYRAAVLDSVFEGVIISARVHRCVRHKRRKLRGLRRQKKYMLLRCGVRAARLAPRSSRRGFCARALFPANANRAALRARYYELAKATHPDSRKSETNDACENDNDDSEFLAVQAAYEELMAELSSNNAKAAGRTSHSAAARGGSAAGGQHRQRRATPRGAYAGRPPTLGEILCQRLAHEPHAFGEVWADTLERNLAVTSVMTTALFKACAASGAGMPAALEIFREATALSLLTAEVRTCSLVSLLTLCKEDNLDTTFEVVDMITDEDKQDPEVFAALSSTFSFFPSGASF